MDLRRPSQNLSLALLFTLTAASSHGLQLGETAAQITARHGVPAAEDSARHTARYAWAGWSADLEFQDGVVGQLSYRTNHPITPAEIDALLQANGGVDRWRETTAAGSPGRQWTRDDGAAATTDPAQSASLLFRRPAPAAPSASATPAPLPAAPLPLESFAQTAAPLSAPAAEPTGKVAVAKPQLRTHAKWRADTAHIPPPIPVPAHPPVAASPAPAGGKWWLLGAVVPGCSLLAFLAWQQTKRPAPRPAATAPHSPPPASAPQATPRPAPPAAVASAGAFSALREDQIALLLGEIFRREGYTVELSAALNTDDGSDLTLRRDGESIPVRSQDWKTARVTARELREFYGLMAGTAAPRGIVVTTGAFTREAQEFAAEKSIELLDRHALEQRSAAVRRPAENLFDVASWIEDFTTHAHIFDPECPSCGQAMVIRRHRTDGTDSWVCSSSPRCAGKRAARPALLILPVVA